jgi:hypothetical protein
MTSVVKMDRITIFKNAISKAKAKWFKDKTESEEMYGEGVLTRKQAKLELSKSTSEEPKNNTDNISATSETDTLTPTDTLNNEQDNVNETKSQDNKSDDENNSTSENENENDTNPKHNLFNDETLVAENDILKVYVVKTFLKRQKKFHLQDHQYTMHFKKKNDQPIMLSSVLDILEKAFFAVLENLKSFYKSHEENFVYMTLTQDNLFNEFRTSPYVLQSNDTK